MRDELGKLIERPGRSAFRVSLGWSLGRVLAGLVDALLRLALVAGIIATAVYTTRHLT